MKKEELRDKDFDPFIDNKKKAKDFSKEDEYNEKNYKKRKNIFTNFDSINTLLTVIFISMLVLTIFLGFKVIKTKKEFKEYIKSSIIVPVLSEGTNNNISVDISNMKKGDEKSYSFKIANNKDNNINPEEVIYGLQLVNTDSVNVEVYKNNGKENILPPSKIILDNKLIKDKEQVDVFTLKIKALKKTKDKELITIKIVS